MNEATKLFEDFVAGRVNAAKFESEYFLIWNQARARGEFWPGEEGKLFAGHILSG